MVLVTNAKGGSDIMFDDTLEYCPHCGSKLEEPIKAFGEHTKCPKCGDVFIEFHRWVNEKGDE